jgi:hypothetical protein
MVPDHESSLRLLSVSWPRPVEVRDGVWISPPDWNAPVMPFLPPWRFQMFDEVGCHALDWTETFRADANAPGRPTPGAMRGFHVVFRARVQRAGLLVFFDSDGSIIRRNGTIVHEDRQSHPVRRHELAVRLGDHLEIAHWISSLTSSGIVTPSNRRSRTRMDPH